MGPAGEAILQIHPTRRCNLRCLHCYSSSGPDERDRLTPEVFERALSDARSEGFRIASFSGGEPTLYKALPQLLSHAKACGMSTTVTSNGMLLSESCLAGLSGVTDVLAISLDGIPDSHNRMRNSPAAFGTMEKHLPGVRASGLRFGFIFTLTQWNLDEMAWAAEFAASHGAKLFQVHPLEEVGRAATRLAGSRPDDVESAYAYLEAERIRKLYEGRMFVQFDLIHRTILQSRPETFFDEVDAADRTLGDLVSPLVIESDGRVVPFGYGFAARYALGFLQEHSLNDLAQKWRRSGFAALQHLCRTAFEEAARERDLPILNWWEQLGERAAQAC